MSEVIRAKAFEPFFTTKEIGKGSGLGLSQVLGFAKQSGGGVGIDTRVGQGTSVRVYLPRATSAVSSQDGRDLDGRSQPAVIATATVLVVDDDDGVREVTASTLRDAGYMVHEAGSGGAALELLERSQRIDVVLVDFAMPGMNGSELARHIRGKFPPLQILFVTGYADTQALAEVGEDNIIRKPFLEGELERKVRMALARQLAAGPDERRRAAAT
jgi:CheY-like chemotaxis protein